MATSIMHDSFMTSTRTNPASVGDLPLELHQQILSYLPWRDQLNCEHVCRAWREDLRGRVSEPRSIVAPWLPQQDFDLALYGALTVHTLVTKGIPFSFKCREGYKLYPGAPIVADFIFHELGEALAEDEHIEPIQCISSFNFLETTGKGADAVVKECPLANLSFLDDMLVLPAYVEEDEIKKLYCRFNRQELVQPQEKSDETVENNETSNQMAIDNGDGDNNDNDDDDDDDNDGNDDGGDDGGDNDSEDDEEDNGNAAGPARKIVSSGTFTTNVNLNPDGSSDAFFYRLTLGALLVQMRDNLLKDVFRLQGIEASNTTYPPDLGGEEIMQLDVERARRRKEYEIGTVVIEQLQFERCSEAQALRIAFNGMVVPEKISEPSPEDTGAASEH